jgi:hypothetical protein
VKTAQEKTCQLPFFLLVHCFWVHCFALVEPRLSVMPGYLTSQEGSGAKASENVITTRHSAVYQDAPDPNRV